MRSSQTSRQNRTADEASSASQQTGSGFRSRPFHCACATAGQLDRVDAQARWGLGVRQDAGAGSRSDAA